MFRECLAFYRLATDETARLWEERYQLELSKLDGSNRFAAYEFVKKWGKEPFFKVSDIMPMAIEDMLASGMNGFLMWWDLDNREIFPKEIAEDIANQLVTANCRDWDYTVYDYIAIERLKPLLSPEVFAEAQRAVLTLLMNKIAEANREEASEKDISAVTLIIDSLFKTSKYFPKSLVQTMAKRLGPEMYAKLFKTQSPYYADSFESIVNKKSKIDEYDIGLIYQYVDGHTYGNRKLTRTDMQQIISKATPAAKEYLRRFLYADGSHHPWHFFMLSEEMTPLDIDYNSFDFPKEIKMLRLSQLFKEFSNESQFGEKWHEMYTDFHIVPL